MSTNGETLFEAFLNQHDEEAWAEILWTLAPSIHEVDKAATRIWFSFFPLSLALAFRESEDPEKLAAALLLKGKYRLEDQIDSSHTFLYGHRYWPEVKRAVAEHAASGNGPSSLDLVTQISDVAGAIAARLRVEGSLVVGITAVAFMTLQQVGSEAFKASPGKTHIDRKASAKSPEQVLKKRAKGDGQGLMGWFRGEAKVYTVAFDENDPEAKFKLINTQELTTAAANDKRDHTARDPRCMTGEGPIPVECRSAACGTCWVGVLEGAEKLSSVGRLEYRKMKEFGYLDSEEDKPLIRLACRAQAMGSVSIVIPPWNGVFGRFLRSRKDAAPEEEVTNR